MTKTTTNLLLMLITILAGIYFYVMYCSSCGTPVVEEEPVKEVVKAPVTPEASSYPFAFSDGDYAYNENDNFNFTLSSSSILMPLSQKVTDGIASLKTYLAENTAKVINLTGYYKSDETNNSAFPNLGLARANAVKNHFVENGISSSQINTMGKLMDDMVPKEDLFLGPIGYELTDKSDDADAQMKALYDQITSDPLVLYFDSGQAAINLTEAQRQKIADISRYLDKVSGATASVIGYTDNTGRRATNIRLGQERANFAKSYLVQNGISSSKIKTSSKGPDDPVATNSTEEGRSKNRRTVVTLN